MNSKNVASVFGRMERREQKRKDEERDSQDDMSRAEYRASLHEKYGFTKWADHLIEEMCDKRDEVSLILKTPDAINSLHNTADMDAAKYRDGLFKKYGSTDITTPMIDEMCKMHETIQSKFQETLPISNDITLRPAKRIIGLYVIVFIVTLITATITFNKLQPFFGIDDYTIGNLWKAIICTGVLLIGYAYLWRQTSVYKISNDCITGTIGIFSRRHTRIAINRVVDYQVIRPLLERMIGLGGLHIVTAGRDGEELIMHQISIEELNIATKRLNELLNNSIAK